MHQLAATGTSIAADELAELTGWAEDDQLRLALERLGSFLLA
jgi:hypothetical protein